MRIIKCDRCGEIVKDSRLVKMDVRMVDEDYMIAKNPSAFWTIARLNDKDLCEKCAMVLSRGFLRPEGEE